MADTNQAETFTERVDVTTLADGAHIGTLEIDVRPGSIREADHQEELNASATGSRSSNARTRSYARRRNEGSASTTGTTSRSLVRSSCRQCVVRGAFQPCPSSPRLRRPSGGRACRGVL